MKVFKVQPTNDARSYKISQALKMLNNFTYDGAVYSRSPYGGYMTDFHPLLPEIASHLKSLYYANLMIWPLQRSLGRRIRGLSSEANATVIHTNGAPDVLGALCKKYCRIPVVHEIYDTFSLYDKRVGFDAPPVHTYNPIKIAFWNYLLHKCEDWESLVHERCDALVYPTEGTRTHSEERYGKLKSVVVHNGILRQDMPKRRLPKLSGIDGKIHCVYTGAITSTIPHRRILPMLKGIASDSRIVLHLYPVVSSQQDADAVKNGFCGYSNVRIHQPLHYRNLYEEITQYDVGLLVLNPSNERLLHRALPNKLFEYVAAGLPVAVPQYESMIDFVKRNGCGTIIADWREGLYDNIVNLREVPFREEFTIDFFVPRLLKLYESLS